MAMPQGLALDVIALNKLQRLFKIIREFRFAGGYVFDYRGDPNRSMNWMFVKSTSPIRAPAMKATVLPPFRPHARGHE